MSQKKHGPKTNEPTAENKRLREKLARLDRAPHANPLGSIAYDAGR